MPTKPRSYSDDWGVATSFGVWGGTHETRARLALGVARRIDPEFFWLQAVGDPGSHDAPELSLSERVPEGHLFYLHPEELAPQTRSGNVADWFVRDDVEAETRLRRIGDFMRLPSLARKLLEGRSATSPTRALVIADANLAEAFYSLEEGGIRRFIEDFNLYAITLVITIGNRPNPNAGDIDYLLYIRPGSEDEGSLAQVECRQGPPPGTAGLFAEGSSRGLNALLEEMRQVRSRPPKD
jgi:hypothetical protein